MSRTYRRKTDPIPDWVKCDYEWYDCHLKKVYHTGKRLKKEIALWRSDSGWYGDYGDTPGWWIHEYHEKPMRRKTSNLKKKVLRLIDYEDCPEFPVFKRPHIYYW